MLLVIFGAGASHDSVDERVNSRPYAQLGRDYMPPLARDLFDGRSDYQDIMSNYPAVKGIVQELRRKTHAGESIEEVMQSLSDSKALRNIIGISATRFYLNHLIKMTTEKWYSSTDGLTNYDALLDMIDDLTGGEAVCLVSFNYDCLLERALERRGVRYSSIQNYIEDAKYVLIKPHGSVNWKQTVQYHRINDDWYKELIEETQKLRLVGGVILEDELSISRSPEYTSLVPVIAIPLKSKNEFVCPSEHVEKMIAMFSDTSHILAIGWRGTEEYFTKLLSEHTSNTKIGIVSHTEDSASEVEQNLKDAKVRGSIYRYGGGFSDFTYNEQLRTFLNT